MLAEYERLHAEAAELHGPSAVLLLQVGSFWEVYWGRDASGRDSVGGAGARDVRDIMGLATMLRGNPGPATRESPHGAGFPMHAEDKISALLDAGRTVCMGEQVPGTASPAVRRLGRCISPAMRPDGAKEGNYACCLFFRADGAVGAALMDVATGCSVVAQTHDYSGVLAVIRARNVTEALICGAGGPERPLDAMFHDRRPSARLGDAETEALLGDAFGREGGYLVEDALLLGSRPLARDALAHLLNWTRRHSIQYGTRLPRPHVVDADSVLSFSKGAAGQLGVPELDKMLNCAATPPGRRLFRHSLHSPMTDPRAIVEALERVQTLVDAGAEEVDRFLGLLAKTGDLQRAARQTVSATYPLADAARLVESVRAALLCATERDAKEAADAARAWLDCLQGYDPQSPVLFPADDGVMSASEDVDALRAEMERIRASLHPDARLDCTADGAYRLSLTKTRLNAAGGAPSEFRSTAYSGGFRLTSAALDAASERMRAASAAMVAEQGRAWTDALVSVDPRDMEALTDWVRRTDVSHACAKNALRFGHVRPTVDADSAEADFVARGLGNPVAERAMEGYSREHYVRNDLALDASRRHVLLYGVNSVGKSCCIKGVGMAIVMAQAGMFVAADALRIAPWKRLDTRILTPDDVQRGLSSFTAELVEIREALNAAGPRSVLLADELCCSTEWRSATALVGTTIARLGAAGSKTFVTTHLHELTDHPGLLQTPGLQVCHMAMSVHPTLGLVYDRRIAEGPCNPSYGIAVAGAFGFDAAFVRDATLAREQLSCGRSAPRKSRWNAKVVVSKCEACGAPAAETHHIKPRSEAVDGKHGTVSMNHPANLMTLCEACHDGAHKAPLARVRALSGYAVVQ